MNKRIRLKRLKVMILTLTMILGCFGARGKIGVPGVSNAQELTTSADSELSVTETGETEGESFSYEDTYNSENFDVNFKLDNVWDTGYNATITITNTSDSVIENWCLTFPLNENIADIWNASVSETHEDFYVIKNAGWNQDIAAGQSVFFGITVYEPFTEYPEYYTILGNEVETRSEDYTVDYKITEDWGEGYKAEVTITNNKDVAIEDWRLTFEYGDNIITQVWNAVIASNIDGKYELSCESYNQNIAPKGSVTFGFMVEPGCSGKLMENVVLKEYVAAVDNTENNPPETEEDMDDVEIIFNTEEFIFDNESQIYYLDNHIVKLDGAFTNEDEIINAKYVITSNLGHVILEGELSISKLWEINDICLIYGENNVVVTVETENGKILEKSIKIYNINLDNLDNRNFSENEVNTFIQEILNSDIDGDGVCDYHEKEILNTDILIQDTDKDGILDGDEDFDLDGLDNSYELSIGTNPLLDDSDFDKIKDNNEIYTFSTNPMLYDTDSDGASDYFEVCEGYNPIEYNICFNFEVSYESKVESFEKITIDMCNASGVAIDTLVVEELIEVPMFGEKIPGYLGSAIELTTEGEYEQAKLTYNINEELFESENFSPALFYFNEENQSMEKVIDQEIVGTILTAELKHFSIYVVLDESKLIDSKVEYIDPEEIESPGTDYFLIVYGDEELFELPKEHFNKQKLMAKNLIEGLNPKDRVSILIYDDGYKMSPFSSSKEELYEWLDNIALEQELTLEENIKIAFDYVDSDDYYKDSNRNFKNSVVVITTGFRYDSMYKYQGILDKKNTFFMFVNIFFDDKYSYLNGYRISSLKPKGKGIYEQYSCDDPLYKADLISILSEEYYDRYFKYKDSDCDGICDYYERCLITGELTTPFGREFRKIKNGDYDTDDDGIIDGDELKVISIGGMAYVFMLSDPTMSDTDGDDVNDLMDPWPLEKHDWRSLSKIIILRNNESYLLNEIPFAFTWKSANIKRDEYYESINVDLGEYYNCVAIHHTNRFKSESIELLERNEIENGDFNGMPYHFVINSVGTIYEGKPLNVKGEAVGGNNSNKVSIALMGNFHSKETGIKARLKGAMPSEPTSIQMYNLELLIKVLHTQYGIDVIGGHCDFTNDEYSTVCPGDILYDKLLENGLIKL